MRFESLGGTGHGCEFGIFQRKFGAEPLGLLRWADLGVEQLCRALESEFEGVGDPENTVVFVPETGHDRPEYWTRDHRHHMAMRSFVYCDEVSETEMIRLARQRLKFLRRKLLEDLRLSEKMFVYKNMKRNLTLEELDRLYAAVRSYGDNTLFYICYSDRNHPAGTVEVISEKPGLILGYTDRFTHTPDDSKFLGETSEIFIELCNAALSLWYSGATQSKPFWRGQKRIFILNNHLGSGVFYRSAFTLGELAVSDPTLDGSRLVEVHSAAPHGPMLWTWRSGVPWLDPGMSNANQDQLKVEKINA